MKKIVIYLLALTLVMGLFGCSKTENTVVEEPEVSVDLSGLKIVSATGAPAVAFYNQATNDNFETNGVPKNIIAMMAGYNGPDFVVIDTASGVNAIKNGAKYKLAATLTFGNFFIAATGNDDDGVMDSDDEILLFGEGLTPDLVFHYLFGSEFDEHITYVAAVNDASAVLQNPEGKDVEGKAYDYIFIAQPVLFASLKKNENASVYANVQELYAEKSEGASLIQASLFVSDEVDDVTYEAFMEALQSDVEAALANAEVIAEGMSKLNDEEAQAKFGIASAPVVAVIKQNNGLGLGFKRAGTIKADIDTFLSITGKEVTDESIYR